MLSLQNIRGAAAPANAQLVGLQGRKVLPRHEYSVVVQVLLQPAAVCESDATNKCNHTEKLI